METPVPLFEHLSALTRWTDSGTGVDGLLREFAGEAASLLKAPRVCIWLRNDVAGEWRCAEVFECDEHSTGPSIPLEAISSYLDALGRESAVVANPNIDAPVFEEWRQSCHETFVIHSRMDVPLVRDGHVMGALCVECRGAERHWSDEDAALLALLAGILSVHLDDEWTRELFEKQKSELALFRLICDLAPLSITAICEVDESGSYLNPYGMKLFGYDRKDASFLADWWRLAYPDLAYRKQVMEEWTRLSTIAKETKSPMAPLVSEVHCKNGSRKTILWGYTNAGRYSISFGLDLTDLKRVEEELRQANATLESRIRDRAAKLETASRLKSEFLANMSHEIRTPMNAILGYAQLMRSDPALPSDQRPRVELINRAGEHLLALINDILEMSKIEAGYITRNDAAFDLHSLLQDLVAIYLGRAKAKGLALTVKMAPSLPRHVISDEAKVRQALVNLIGNAVKFTSTGSVTISADASENQDGTLRLVFSVSDTGPGIADEEFEKLFRPFVQSAAGMSMGGTGLGLAISRQYARILDGEITVASKRGVGSTFTVVIKVAPAQPVEISQKADRPEIHRLASGQTARILVVDDVAMNCELLADILNAAGFETKMACNGKEALELFDSWNPDAVLMDMHMPVMDGYEANRQIRVKSNGGSVLIIGLTASAFEQDRSKVLDSGADYFMRKPFKRNELLAIIGERLNLRYECEAEASTETTKDAPPTEALHVSVAMLTQLKKVIGEADYDGLMELCEQLTSEGNMVAANELRRRALDYDYAALEQLLRRVQPE